MAQHDNEDILAGDNPLTLWHFADPSEAVNAALALYGPKAALAAASAAFTARYAGREDDFRFWFAVFSQLKCCEREGASTPKMLPASDEQPIVSHSTKATTEKTSISSPAFSIRAPK